jgi:DNA-binding CsgD family transcriptional regulator
VLLLGEWTGDLDATMTWSDELQRTIPLAYEAALDSTLWPQLLQRMLGLLGGHCGSFISRRPDGSGARWIEMGFDPTALAQFQSHYAHHNPLFARGGHNPAGAIVSDRDLLPKAEFRQTEYYNDLLMKQENTNAILTAFLWRDPEKFVVFNCNRAPNRPEYEVVDKEYLAPLLPHVARAIDVALRLDSFGTAAAGTLGRLERASEAVLVLDENASLLYANAAGERLLAEQDGLSCGSVGLMAATPRLTAQLQAAIARAARGVEGGALQLARPRRGRPLYAVTAPLLGETDWLRAGRRRVLLLVRDPAERAALSHELLQGLFRLTPAEAALAARLYHGEDLAQAAAALRISRHTARAHLNAILEKTETGRQAELIRRLAIVAELAARPPASDA